MFICWDLPQTRTIVISEIQTDTKISSQDSQVILCASRDAAHWLSRKKVKEEKERDRQQNYLQKVLIMITNFCLKHQLFHLNCYFIVPSTGQEEYS